MSEPDVHGGSRGRRAVEFDVIEPRSAALLTLVATMDAMLLNCGVAYAFTIFRSTARWCSWFRGSAWDSSWFVVDRERFEVLVLCVTDVD